MAVEVIVQTGDAQGALDTCVSFFGLPIDESVRLAILSDHDALRHALFDCVCNELSVVGDRGGCGGTPGGGTLRGCRAHDSVGVRHVAVLPVDGSSIPSIALETTVQALLARPGSTALGVLPVGVPMSSLPASARRHQAARYASTVCDAVDDVLAAAGVEPEERVVFVSYSRADAALVLPLVDALADQRFRVYLDTRSNPPASLWEEVLVDALVDAALVVVLETANSTRSNWVQREIGLAQARGAAVIAVQPGPPFPFRGVTARFIGPPGQAAPFVTRQHRLLVTMQRERRVRSVVDALASAGLPVDRNGAIVDTTGHRIGVQPRPVTLRQLRRITDSARAAGLRAVTFSPLPVLAARRLDRRWMHDESGSLTYSVGSLRSLVRQVSQP
jgi:hypothetical protein